MYVYKLIKMYFVFYGFIFCDRRTAPLWPVVDTSTTKLN